MYFSSVYVWVDAHSFSFTTWDIKEFPISISCHSFKSVCSPSRILLLCHVLPFYHFFSLAKRKEKSGTKQNKLFFFWVYFLKRIFGFIFNFACQFFSHIFKMAELYTDSIISWDLSLNIEEFCSNNHDYKERLFENQRQMHLMFLNQIEKCQLQLYHEQKKDTIKYLNNLLFVSSVLIKIYQLIIL